MSSMSKDDEVYEEQHVHQVYEQIAQHFSATRYKVSSHLTYLNLFKAS